MLYKITFGGELGRVGGGRRVKTQWKHSRRRDGGIGRRGDGEMEEEWEHSGRWVVDEWSMGGRWVEVEIGRWGEWAKGRLAVNRSRVVDGDARNPIIPDP